MSIEGTAHWNHPHGHFVDFGDNGDCLHTNVVVMECRDNNVPPSIPIGHLDDPYFNIRILLEEPYHKIGARGCRLFGIDQFRSND